MDSEATPLRMENEVTLLRMDSDASPGEMDSKATPLRMASEAPLRMEREGIPLQVESKSNPESKVPGEEHPLTEAPMVRSDDALYSTKELEALSMYLTLFIYGGANLKIQDHPYVTFAYLCQHKDHKENISWKLVVSITGWHAIYTALQTLASTEVYRPLTCSEFKARASSWNSLEPWTPPSAAQADKLMTRHPTEDQFVVFSLTMLKAYGELIVGILQERSGVANCEHPGHAFFRVYTQPDIVHGLKGPTALQNLLGAALTRLKIRNTAFHLQLFKIFNASTPWCYDTTLQWMRLVARFQQFSKELAQTLGFVWAMPTFPDNKTWKQLNMCRELFVPCHEEDTESYYVVDNPLSKLPDMMTVIKGLTDNKLKLWRTTLDSYALEDVSRIMEPSNISTRTTIHTDEDGWIPLPPWPSS